jgi:nifR3 family TIM-barrel protein
MDGITDTAYRQVVRSLNPGVVLFSEFTSADGFARSARVRQRLEFAAAERPYFVQLFGSTVQTFVEAARALEAQGVTGIDINMGCPAKKIVASMHGSGLMREPALACRIVEAVARACRVDVSVKTRLGWRDAAGLIPFARSLADAGASLLTIHGRTYDQGFKGQADWAPIQALKREIGIPVIGNGDVADLADGLRRMGNLDGFMIGRAAIGNPWAFRPPGEPAPPLPERVAAMLDHFERMLRQKPERLAVIEFRKHMVGYLKGFDFAKHARRTLLEAPDRATLMRQLEALAADGWLPELPHVVASAAQGMALAL